MTRLLQHRCIRRIRELQQQGKTILFVSHDMAMVKAVCSRAIFLDAGRMLADGEPGEIARLYHAHVSGLETRRGEAVPTGGSVAAARPAVFRRTRPRPAGLFHSRYASGLHPERRGARRGKPTHRAAAFDQPVSLRVHLDLPDVPYCILGYYLSGQERDRRGGHEHLRGERGDATAPGW